MMTESESNNWRPELPGWSSDILPFFESIADELPNPCTVVEVGSAHGRSAIFLAEQLVKRGHGSHSKIFMVDDWGGGWFAECLPSIVKHALPKELELLRPIRATSRRAAAMFTKELDLTFIDGDHSRIGCADDLDLWYTRTKPNGIYAGHDFDKRAHPGVARAVTEFAELVQREIQTPTRSVWRLK